MREVGFSEYLDYVEKRREVRIEDQVISLEPIEVSRLHPSSEELTDVSTTVWSFPKRGSWATHRGDYRGNWAPQMARALILSYTEPGDTVLDPMVGSGTTCVEAKLLGRNCIGVDINYNAVILTLHRLYWLERALEERGYVVADSRSLSEFTGSRHPEGFGTSTRVGDVDLESVKKAWHRIYLGDARDLNAIGSGSIDLVATHPPYFNIVRYGDAGGVEGDLSRAGSLEKYLEWMRIIARELYRVLKPGRYCALLIGDTRIHRHYVPISHHVLNVFLDAGFILKEEVVKIQHKMKTTREVWSRYTKRDFLLIYHEKLYIFRKPDAGEDLDDLKYSRKLNTC